MKKQCKTDKELIKNDVWTDSDVENQVLREKKTPLGHCYHRFLVYGDMFMTCFRFMLIQKQCIKRCIC